MNNDDFGTNRSSLRRTIGGLLMVAGVAMVLGGILNICQCSPVNVQVQNCQNEVRDSRGITFTGCKVDGNQDADADGELRVNIPAKSEESGSPTRWIPLKAFGLQARLTN